MHTKIRMSFFVEKYKYYVINSTNHNKMLIPSYLDKSLVNREIWRGRSMFQNWQIHNIFFSQFYVQLLDYSIILKARNDKLIHESINLSNHDLIWRSWLKMKEDTFYPRKDLSCSPLEPKASVLPDDNLGWLRSFSNF